MDWLSLLNEIFEVCVIPLLGVLTMFLVQLIRKKTAEVVANSENELLNKYTQMLSDTVVNCITATNQTYVEALKKEGKFDAEAQQKAFDLTKTAVENILNEDAKNYLTTAYGDLGSFINIMIESKIESSKTPTK